MIPQNEQPHSAALAADETLSARTATAPRVSVEDLKANVAEVWYVNAAEAVSLCDDTLPTTGHPLDLMTLCFVVTRNGFVVVGKHVPASAENFDADKGRTFAYEDAMRQLWPLMGYGLRQRLHDGVEALTLPSLVKMTYNVADEAP